MSIMHELLGFWHFMFSPIGAPWYTGAFWSNQTQWTVVWIPTIIFVFYKALKCKQCWRVGRIKVEGTHYKTCLKHTNDKDHAALIARHKRHHPKLHEFLKKQK